MTNHFLVKIKLIVLLLSVTCVNLVAQVKISEEKVALPTYNVEPAEKAPIFFTGESFQGARRQQSTED